MSKHIVNTSEIRYCDYCSNLSMIAEYDGKTINGCWAYMCEFHFYVYGIGLGLGKGQKLMYTEGN